MDQEKFDRVVTRCVQQVTEHQEELLRITFLRRVCIVAAAFFLGLALFSGSETDRNYLIGFCVAALLLTFYFDWHQVKVLRIDLEE